MGGEAHGIDTVSFKQVRITVFSAALIFGGLSSCGLAEELERFMADPGIETPDLSRTADGTYTGEYAVGPISVVVEVEMKGHEITRCTILKHRSGRGKPAEAITDTIVEMQSLDVDAVAGATYSSAVIRKAVQVAIQKGL